MGDVKVKITATGELSPMEQNPAGPGHNARGTVEVHIFLTSFVKYFHFRHAFLHIGFDDTRSRIDVDHYVTSAEEYYRLELESVMGDVKVKITATGEGFDDTRSRIFLSDELLDFVGQYAAGIISGSGRVLLHRRQSAGGGNGRAGE